MPQKTKLPKAPGDYLNQFIPMAEIEQKTGVRAEVILLHWIKTRGKIRNALLSHPPVYRDVRRVSRHTGHFPEI